MSETVLQKPNTNVGLDKLALDNHSSFYLSQDKPSGAWSLDSYSHCCADAVVSYFYHSVIAQGYIKHGTT